MANNNWNNYTEKNAALTDKDEIMLRDSTDGKNKRSPLSKIWNYMVDKMATAVISKLETDNKTIIGAINYLYGNRADAGTATFGASTEEKRIEKITFKRPFHEIPKVVATYAENNAYNYGREICVYNISTTGFTAETFISLSGATLAFNWVAVCSK